LFVGRLEKQKNLSALIQAMAQVQAHIPARLKLIGKGSLESDLRKQAARLGVEVEFAGMVPHEHLPEELNAADVFVLPSFIEGHPKTLIEAMSCGRPCVVSNCPGNRALVRHEDTGLMFDAHDVPGLAWQLLRVLSDQELAERLGRAARERAVREWDLNRLIEREVELLKSLALQ